MLWNKINHLAQNKEAGTHILLLYGRDIVSFSLMATTLIELGAHTNAHKNHACGWIYTHIQPQMLHTVSDH